MLYCYHAASYYSANLYRVVDLIKTGLYFKTRHFILFYFTLLPLVSPRDSFPIHYRSRSDKILCSCCSTGLVLTGQIVS